MKLILLVYWYPLVTMYLYCINYELDGSLRYIGASLHRRYCNEAFIYAILGYYLLVILVWKLKNTLFSFEKIKSNELSRSIFVFLFLVVSIIAFPRAFGVGNERWNLIPGPWVVVFIAMNLVLFTSYVSLKQKSSILHFIILIISFIGGERANSVIVLVLFFLFIPHKSIMTERKIKYYYGVLFFLLAVLGIAVQSWRSGKIFSSQDIYTNLISLTTVSDVVHIYFSAFNYVDKYPLTINPLINEVASMFNIPVYGGAGLEVDYNFTEILRKHIQNYGGGLFYTEGVLIFGKVGVLIHTFLYGYLIRFLYLNKNRFAQILMLVFITLQMRIQWYGFMYIYTPVWLTYLLVVFLEKLNRIKSF
ncbi:hypothetical protein N9901_00540 [Flavobacteriaceae bacterium]|nr:hypothetical protein [Flavobacteriaceae bacterium]